MGRVDDIVAGFTLAGVLDETSKTREKFPIAEIALGDIASHPANSAYSMNKAAIKSLAESIKRDGLTDMPLVRRLEDGSFQMISGHRRKAAYELLLEHDDTYSKLPCRIIDGIDDVKAVTLLHSANYFTRELTALERGAATRALEPEIEKLRKDNPELKGVRTSDIKASLLKAQTGQDISGRTVSYHEKIATIIDEVLIPELKDKALFGELSDRQIIRLGKCAESEQRDFLARGEFAIKEQYSNNSAEKILKKVRELNSLLASSSLSLEDAETIRGEIEGLLGLV
jgi:ParB family chromosome partitioning protein